MDFKHRQVPGGAILVYSIGRTTLIENYLAEMERGDMRIVNNEMSRRAQCAGAKYWQSSQRPREF